MEEKKRRILIICKGHNNIAGAQLYLKQISSLFPRHKYELHFALRKKDGLRVFDEIAQTCSVCLWDYDWRHFSVTTALSAGIKLFSKINPDIIIFNSSEDKVLATIWAAWLCRIEKRVMVVHWAQSQGDLPLFRRKPHVPIPVPSRYSIKTRLLRSLGFSLLDKIIFVSNVTLNSYTHLYGIPRRRCAVIHNGIDVQAFSNLAVHRTRTRRQLHIRPQECMVLTTGNLTEVKGHKYLISAIHNLVRKDLPIKCFIAGQGELEGDLKRQIANLRLQNHVRLMGYRDDIPSLLAASDIFCFPSLNEALGYSLLEAIAAGIPVVASAVGGIPEVITNERDGLLVPPGNVRQLSMAIEQLALNVDLRYAFGCKGQETARQRFSLDRMLTQTRNLFTNQLAI